MLEIDNAPGFQSMYSSNLGFALILHTLNWIWLGVSASKMEWATEERSQEPDTKEVDEGTTQIFRVKILVPKGLKM